MTRKISVPLVCTVVVLVSRLSGAAPNVVSWSPCYKDFGPFQCGTVQVPLDHDNPTGPTISIAMVRLQAIDPARRIGSLFVNPGGPGGSGIDFVLFAAALLAPPEVLARFDLVGFDPRGVGRSTALKCFGNAKQALATFVPFPFPITPEEEAVWISGELELVGSCDQRAGRIHDHMTTADVAKDLDLLRAAVGDESLNYVGYSYGSYLGVTYANLFPDKVRAVVVDGVLDPVAWATGVGDESDAIPFSTRLRSSVGAQSTLGEFFRLCDAGACAFGPASTTRFAALADQLRAAPLVIAFPDGSVLVFTYQALIANALGAMYDSSSWPSFAQFLFAVESLASPQGLGARLQAFWDQAGFTTKRGFPNYPSFEAGPRVFCSDSDNPTTYAAWPLAAAGDLEGGYFGAIWTWISSLCATWGGPAASRFAGPFGAATAKPVLVVGNRFDPATPYHGAQAVASLLPSSVLLTLDGWGHTSLLLSQCVTAAVTNYLITLATPPQGTVCSQDFVPFSLSASAPAASADASRRRAARKAVNRALLTPVLRGLP
jgi:pimeloyl-ACP methyl ester carboxylesterase